MKVSGTSRTLTADSPQTWTVAEHGSGLGLGRTRRKLKAGLSTGRLVLLLQAVNRGDVSELFSGQVMQHQDLTSRETAVGNGITSKRRLDTRVKSTTDLCEDGSELDDDAEKVNARISVDGAVDCNKNKCRTAKNTAVASATAQ